VEINKMRKSEVGIPTKVQVQSHLFKVQVHKINSLTYLQVQVVKHKKKLLCSL